jgi:O-antigen ligase
MTIALPLGLMFVGAVAKDKRLLYLTAIGLTGVALILSGSRGGLFALLAEVLFLLFLTSKNSTRGRKFVRIGAAVALLATIIIGAYLVGGETSLTRLAETAASKDISTDRWHIWGVSLEIIKNYFPFGSGLGTFGLAYTQFDSLNGLARVEQAHNDYLQVLTDAGLIGAIIGGFFLVWFFRTGFRVAKVENRFRRGVAIGAFAGATAILVHSIFDFVLHTTAIAILFLMLCALMVICGREFKDDFESPNGKRRRRSAPIAELDEIRVSRPIRS